MKDKNTSSEEFLLRVKCKHVLAWFKFEQWFANHYSLNGQQKIFEAAIFNWSNPHSYLFKKP